MPPNDFIGAVSLYAVSPEVPGYNPPGRVQNENGAVSDLRYQKPKSLVVFKQGFLAPPEPQNACTSHW